jgi:hypothetical protein
LVQLSRDHDWLPFQICLFHADLYRAAMDESGMAAVCNL